MFKDLVFSFNLFISQFLITISRIDYPTWEPYQTFTIDEIMSFVKLEATFFVNHHVDLLFLIDPSCINGMLILYVRKRITLLTPSPLWYARVHFENPSLPLCPWKQKKFSKYSSISWIWWLKRRGVRWAVPLLKV